MHTFLDHPKNTLESSVKASPVEKRLMEPLKAV
jgi:hypothetical protein